MLVVRTAKEANSIGSVETRSREPIQVIEFEEASLGAPAPALVGKRATAAVALENLAIMEREHLAENAAAMGERLVAGLRSVFSDHPNVGDIRGGRGLLAAVEFVADRATKENFAGHLKVAANLKLEMMRRGVITRTRPAVGAHPAPGDILFFAPPLVVTAADIDRLVSVTQDAVGAVLSAVCS